MFCPKCGTEIAKEALFCMKCGAKIEQIPNMVNEQSAEVAVEEPKTSEKAPNVDFIKKIEENKNSKKIFMGIIIGVIILAIIKILTGFGGEGGVSLGKYEPAEDLKVVGATLDHNGYTVVVVENTGDKTVQDYEVAYIGYDSAGNPVKLDGSNWHEIGLIQTANIMPGETYGLNKTFYTGNSSISYVEAAVNKITYTDGSEWIAKNIESWVKAATEEFSVEEYKQSIEDMKALAVLAESNPYIQLEKSKKYSDNRFSNQDDLDVYYKNIGSQDVRSIESIIMQYDSNGYAVNVSPYSYVTINCRKTSFEDANVVAGGTASGNNSLFFESDCEDYKILITELEFMDGTKWTNKNTFQWILYNQNKR